MRARAVQAGRGWQWIVEGFNLFLRAPLLWVAVTVIFLVIWLASIVIPLVGPLLFHLFSPVLLAGLMLGCRALDSGGELKVSHLFAGFQNNAAALVTIGGVYLAGTIVMVGLIVVTGGSSVLSIMTQKPPAEMQMAAGAVRSVLLGLAVYVPLLMLIWFAPLLVVFENLKPLEAMKLSFSACLGNLLPFLLYGLVVLILWIIAAIPLLLGFLVLLPVLMGSVYASYKDIFAASSAGNGDNPLLQ